MVGQRLLNLAWGIAQYEGWAPNNLNTANVNEETIAFRHNNPGNLRSSPFMIGQQNGFAYFYNEEVGKMALIWDLFQKCQGKTVTGLKPTSTLADLIKVYAPENENNTEAYIQYIEARTGFKRTMKLQELLEK